MSNTSVADLLDKSTSRRRFIRDGGVVALIAGIGASCKPETPKAVAAQASAAGQTGGTMGAHDTSAGAAAMANAEAMDAMHEKGIKAFPAKTVGLGNQLLAPKIVAGVKVFELTAKRSSGRPSPVIQSRPGRTTIRFLVRRFASLRATEFA